MEEKVAWGARVGGREAGREEGRWAVEASGRHLAGKAAARAAATLAVVRMAVEDRVCLPRYGRGHTQYMSRGRSHTDDLVCTSPSPVVQKEGRRATWRHGAVSGLSQSGQRTSWMSKMTCPLLSTTS